MTKEEEKEFKDKFTQGTEIAGWGYEVTPGAVLAYLSSKKEEWIKEERENFKKGVFKMIPNLIYNGHTFTISLSEVFEKVEKELDEIK